MHLGQCVCVCPARRSSLASAPSHDLFGVGDACGCCYRCSSIAECAVLLLLTVVAAVPQGSELWVHLSHPWCDCRVAAGDKANIIGGTRTVDGEGRTHAYLDLANGTFVLHPDVLLSGVCGCQLQLLGALKAGAVMLL